MLRLFDRGLVLYYWDADIVDWNTRITLTD